MSNPPPNRVIKVMDISNEIGYWFIKVKVLRMWPQVDSTNDYSFLSSELVLMDSEGTKIQGSIPADVFHSANFDIAEEGYYKIGRVQVVNNDGLQRATTHPFRLIFSHRSLVKPWQPQNLCTSYGLTPLTVAQIKTYKNELQHFVDIVGLCTSISSERVHVLDGRVVNMVLLEISDETGSLECALYDQYVDQIHDHFKVNGMRRTVVVLQFTKMVPFDPALFGDCVIQIIPNLTRLLFNSPIDEVFEAYDCLDKHGIDVFAPLRHVTIDRVDVDKVDEFLLSFRRKEVTELCFQAKAGRYVVLATLGSVVGNDQWWELYEGCRAKGFQNHPLGFSYNDKNLLPRYNVKAQVFDGPQCLNLLLNDHHVMKVLFKFTKQPIIGNLEEAFQCIIGKKFLFIVEKGCGHALNDDDWLRAYNMCGDPEILRVFVDRDHYPLKIMAKAEILSALRKYSPIDDSFLTSNQTSGVDISGPLMGHDVGEASSSGCVVKNPIGGEKRISRSLDLEFCESKKG